MFNIVQGNTGVINPATNILDTGWTVDGVNAVHTPCNAGTMIALNDFGLVVGRSYVFTYEVVAYNSGGVKIIAGTTNGTTRNALGTFTQTLLMAGNALLSFFSNGDLTIQQLSFYDALTGQQPGRTVSFNERENKWGSEYSFQPETMLRFIDKLFSFKNGGLWQHNVNPVMNNFYGVQYSSQVMFIFNKDYKNNKLWYNLRLDSTGKWYAPSLSTPPDDQFPNGMESVLTNTNIKSIDGKLWADVLRDITDPNFFAIQDPQLRAATALFQGRMMQGGWLIVILQNDDTTPASLSSAEVFYIDVKKSI